MNHKQKVKILKVIKSDCQIRRRYQDEQGQTCAIGGMAKAAGIKLPPAGSRNNGVGITGLKRMSGNLRKHYGLRIFDLMQIQGLNDEIANRRQRKKLIAEYVGTLTITL